jgi:hypothetical protein
MNQQANQQQRFNSEPMEAPQQVVEPGTLATLAKAEVDIQVATAHRYPRSISRFKHEALALATLDEETAASCFYCLSRGGKDIEGPSVRLAEIVGSAWGNLRYGARVVNEDSKFITAQGVCHDLEKNIAATVDVQRRITDRNGRRYSDDMIVVTANAACSIALRNAIFKVVPFAVVKSIYEQAKLVAIGNAQTLVGRRTKAMERFAKMGISQERVLASVGKNAIDDVDLDDLQKLTGTRTAILEGTTTVDEAFPLEPTTPPVGKQSLPRQPKPAPPLTSPPDKAQSGSGGGAIEEMDTGVTGGEGRGPGLNAPTGQNYPDQSGAPFGFRSPERQPGEDDEAAEELSGLAELTRNSIVAQIDEEIDGSRNPKSLKSTEEFIWKNKQQLGDVQFARLAKKVEDKIKSVEARKK